jgi:hypothetical protein
LPYGNPYSDLHSSAQVPQSILRTVCSPVASSSLGHGTRLLWVFHVIIAVELSLSLMLVDLVSPHAQSILCASYLASRYPCGQHLSPMNFPRSRSILESLISYTSAQRPQ